MGEEWWCGFLRQTMACGQTGGRKGSSSPYRKVVVIRRWSPSGRQWKQSKWWLVVPLVPWGGAVTALFLADILGMRGGISSSESIWEVVVGGPSGDPSQRSTSSGGGEWLPYPSSLSEDDMWQFVIGVHLEDSGNSLSGVWWFLW